MQKTIAEENSCHFSLDSSKKPVDIVAGCQCFHEFMVERMRRVSREDQKRVLRE